MPSTIPRACIVDYGMGNLFSIKRVISYLGGEALISSHRDDITRAERLILPGVGAFGDGMENLKKRELISPIKEFIASGRALLGICLGMQLLMTESEEFGVYKGLNIISGSVKRLDPETENGNYKIPHVGWNTIEVPNTAGDNGHWNSSILEKITPGEFFYFVHSYTVIPDSKTVVLSETEYGNNIFCSTLKKDNVTACQFHPEISGEEGLSLLRQFLYNV